jgi:hypothetical protein
VVVLVLLVLLVLVVVVMLPVVFAVGYNWQHNAGVQVVQSPLCSIALCTMCVTAVCARHAPEPWL